MSLKTNTDVESGYDFWLGAVGAKRIGKIASSARHRSIVDYRPLLNNINCILHLVNLGHTVAQLVEALRYKPEGRGFDFR